MPRNAPYPTKNSFDLYSTSKSYSLLNACSIENQCPFLGLKQPKDKDIFRPLQLFIPASSKLLRDADGQEIAFVYMDNDVFTDMHTQNSAPAHVFSLIDRRVKEGRFLGVKDLIYIYPQTV
jgi:hypothetical protein